MSETEVREPVDREAWIERKNLELMELHVDRTGNCGVRGYFPTSPWTAKEIDYEIGRCERALLAPQVKRAMKGRL